MAIFRIAHITDLHFSKEFDWKNPFDGGITKDAAHAALQTLLGDSVKSGMAKLFCPSGYNPNVAQALLKSLTDNLFGTDAVLVTGDLATTGEQIDLEMARDFLSGNVDFLPNIVLPHDQPIAGQLRVLTLPGNHDRYFGLSKIPQSKKFESVFGQFWDLNRNVAQSIIPVPEESGRVRFSLMKKDNEHLAIVMADFSLQSFFSGRGTFGYIGQGKAYPRAIKELIHTTNFIRKAFPNAEVIWAVHFPPDFPHVNSNLRFIKDERFIQAAYDLKINLVLAGHTHETCGYSAQLLGGKFVDVICSGPSCGVSSHNKYAYSEIVVDIKNGKKSKYDFGHFSYQNLRFVKQATFPHKKHTWRFNKNT